MRHGCHRRAGLTCSLRDAATVFHAFCHLEHPAAHGADGRFKWTERPQSFRSQRVCAGSRWRDILSNLYSPGDSPRAQLGEKSPIFSAAAITSPFSRIWPNERVFFTQNGSWKQI